MTELLIALFIFVFVVSLILIIIYGGRSKKKAKKKPTSYIDEDKLIDAIKNPIPKDCDSIRMRAKWLTISCFVAASETKELFYKTFRTISMPEKEEGLILEMSQLILSTALEMSKLRFINEFQGKIYEDPNEIFDKYIEKPALDTLMQLFENKTVDDVFDPYVSYSCLKSEYAVKCNEANKGDQSEFIKKMQKQIRKFHSIDDDTTTKEKHFTKRIRILFKDIEEYNATIFAKRHVSIQGVFLAMDAFAAVDQDEINRSVNQLYGL